MDGRLDPDSMVARGLANGNYQTTKQQGLTALTRVLHDLAKTAVDLRTDHVKAHSGHPWNELADSLAKREARAEQDSHPQPEWTRAFIADREREWEWMRQADAHTLNAYPTLTPTGLVATAHQFY